MHNISKKANQKSPQWLLFFYSVPSKPVSSRMRIWRKLAKAGAVQMKGAVYILPFNDEHYEFLQWLVSEIAGMKGEAAVVSIEKIDTMQDAEIVALFDQQRAGDYKALQKSFDDLGRRLGSIQKGAKLQNIKGITDQFAKLQKEFEDIKRLDFFSSQKGAALGEKIKRLQTELKVLSEPETKQAQAAALTLRSPGDYKNRTWATRKKPFIDRMASAWLIKRFIDKDAAFDFVDEKDMAHIDKVTVTFDIRNGEFTHSGDMCTFEVLLRSFSLKDKTLRKMAEIVHDLDMKDDKFGSAEARGLEDILEGVRKTAKNDQDALEKGMAVFEMLYVSKS